MYNYDRETCSYSSFKVANSTHKHIPNPEKIVKREVNASLKTIVEENVNVKTSEVVDQLSTKFVNTPEDAPVLGNIAHLKRNIQYAKKRVTGERRIGTCREDFVLPQELKIALLRQPSDPERQFLLVDIPGKDRKLIFATQEFLEVCIFVFYSVLCMYILLLYVLIIYIFLLTYAYIFYLL